MKPTRLVLPLSALLLLGACAMPGALKPSNWHMPWRKPPPAAPAPVDYVLIEGEGGAAAPAVVQTWNRNALRLDLTAVAGAGALVLKPRADIGWPVRIEFAVRPGNFRRLDVRGAQRVQFTVSEAGETQTLALSPGVYAATATAVSVRWD